MIEGVPDKRVRRISLKNQTGSSDRHECRGWYAFGAYEPGTRLAELAAGVRALTGTAIDTFYGAYAPSRFRID